MTGPGRNRTSHHDTGGSFSLRVLRQGLVIGFIALLATGCFGRSSGPSESERRAPCDRLAAQAIDAEDLGDARRLAARAVECYSGLQTGG